MNSLRKYLPIALLVGFLLFGLDAFFQSKPSAKNRYVYTTVQNTVHTISINVLAD